ncbi:MAG: Glycosyltransferase [Candidatus Woesebacteria bacterium GW2011_GWA1_33_30]|uniref:Glycosyltransferase n=1 Tax=Candidatus Woesebacteria bacterium GW2011_GWA2_33_28 TaxID=1618561 RepID=A0A0F9ZV62_9BACT|nr:MAG: Glycosyltransferase [Candidatus Woesebacteria bacterium GW2011_GWA2_33_28]KKP49090.1 MAG: Glycosyltransferase [Candidatus Woesebacteria bacterium GW2011_GWA1_33_30]KKP50310.1 MAG: Glycosyltransferase [Microgenomates group bacterium GW2011_GWC1_33_32]KKP52681.1 MAG: Glycosyltransferase [Candidatus Woesebacteria bacterium GW2011_GWB1_33_38]KKP58736.1 MAG: Glycosyltransferase [Microgenomates group bacterium GW2011_GWD1_33_9]
MKILFVDFEYPPLGGGGGIGNKALVDELSKKHQIDVLTSHYKGLPMLEKKGNVCIYRAPILLRKSIETSTLVSLFTYCISAAFIGLKQIRNKNYDVIHSFFAVPSGLVGILLSKISKVPHVLTILGGDIHDPTKILSPSRNFFTKSAVKYVLNNSDYVAAISTDVAERARKFYKLNRDSDIKIISFSLKKPDFVLPKVRKYASFTITTIARLVRRKRIADLIRAIKKIDTVRLKIIGDGPLRLELENLARENGVSNRVDFVGFVNEKTKYKILKASHCFALISSHEGFGIVYLEAMYCSLPVIAGNIGGHNDFLVNKETGFIIKVGDVNEIAKSIELLKNHQIKRSVMGVHNKKIVGKYYIEKIAKQYENVYQIFSKK